MTAAVGNVVRGLVGDAHVAAGTLVDDMDGFVDILRTSSGRAKYTDGMAQLGFARESLDRVTTSLDDALAGTRLSGVSDTDVVPGAIRRAQFGAERIGRQLDDLMAPHRPSEMHRIGDLVNPSANLRDDLAQLLDDIPETQAWGTGSATDPSTALVFSNA